MKFSRELANFSPEVLNHLRGGAHLPSKSGMHRIYIDIIVNISTDELLFEFRIIFLASI